MLHFGSLFLSAFLILCFQNCSKIGVTELPSKVDTTSFDTSSTPDDGDNINDGGDDLPDGPVVCDPFSVGSACALDTDSGLIGRIYYLANGVGVQSYIDRGTDLGLTLIMSHLDIPKRDWSSGFPGPDGVLKDTSGNVLNEWFALDILGYFTLPTSFAEGNYQFAVASDDGSILNLAGSEIVNNDGTHGVQWKCSSSFPELKHNSMLPIRLRYNQGPRYAIALQVFFRQANLKNQPCNESGQWQALPAAALSH